jgi:anti-anti-sigma regulatory factor
VIIDLTDAEVRGHGAANVLAHAAQTCKRRRIGFAVVGPPEIGATPSPSGQVRYRAFGSVEEAADALEQSDDDRPTKRIDPVGGP